MSRHAAPRGRRARAPAPPATPPAPRPPGAPGRGDGPGGVVGEVGRGTHLAVAGVAVVVGAGLVVATRWERLGVLVAVAVLQALLVPAWVHGTALPGRIGGTLLGLGTAAAADIVLVARDRVTLLALLGVLGVVLPAMVVHQLTRGVVRVRVTESLGGIAFLLTAMAGLSVLVALARAVDGPRLVAVLAAGAAAGLAAARLVDAVAPAPRLADDVAHGLPALLAAALAGTAAGIAGPLDTAAGAVLGGVVGTLAALVTVAVGYVTATVPDRRRATGPAAAYLGVAVPVALAAPVGYLVALAVAG